MAGPYGGFDFEKTILAAKAGAEDRNIRIATQAVKNQQFEKEMALRKSQLNERIRSNKAVEDYRDRTLSQADEHFEENLGQRQTEFAQKHDLDERTQSYFQEINDKRFELDEDKFQEVKREFDVTTGYNYDVLDQDWDKFKKNLKQDWKKFKNTLSEDKRQYNKTLKQRKHEFKETHGLDEDQFQEVRQMNKWKRTLSNAEFEQRKVEFEKTHGYKYDVLAQDMLKLDKTLSEDLYKYNRSQSFEEYKYEDIKDATRVDPSLMPRTGLPSVKAGYGANDFLGDLTYIGSGAGVGAALGASATLGVGALPGAIIGGGAAVIDLMMGEGPSSTMRAREVAPSLDQAETWLGEVEGLAPSITNNPQNQSVLSMQLSELQTQLEGVKKTKQVKNLSKRIAALEGQVTIPGLYNAKSMLSK